MSGRAGAHRWGLCRIRAEGPPAGASMVARAGVAGKTAGSAGSVGDCSGRAGRAAMVATEGWADHRLASESAEDDEEVKSREEGGHEEGPCPPIELRRRGRGGGAAAQQATTSAATRVQGWWCWQVGRAALSQGWVCARGEALRRSARGQRESACCGTPLRGRALPAFDLNAARTTVRTRECA